MIIGNDRSREVRDYLRKAKWIPDAPGLAGELWRQSIPHEEEVVLAVPNRIQSGSSEWHGLVERVAKFEKRSAAIVDFEIENLYVDVMRFSAANALIIDQSIPLSAGVDLVSTAYRMLRASATTARQVRAHIGGNFSKVGDEIVQRARLGHTEHGSYVLPVFMPLSIEPIQMSDDLMQGQPGLIDSIALETEERRVTRTMAEALAAINGIIVHPAKELARDDVPRLVASGVSKELVVAIDQALSDAAVEDFDASFQWAGGVLAPTKIPAKVSVPSGARDLLGKAAKLLSSSRRDPTERVTGPIVQVRHLPDDLFGEFALQTMRHGRFAEIRVRMEEHLIPQSLEWMKTSRTIVVEGRVIRDPGKPLKVDAPIQIYPLDESILNFE